MESREVLIGVIVYGSLVVLLVTLIGIISFLFYQKSRNKLLIQRAEERQKFQQELTHAQVEMQEQTYRNLSWELHDNIGQLLSIANLEANRLRFSLDKDEQLSYQELRNVLRQGVNEVRLLSHALNADVVSRAGLKTSLENELERFKRLNFLEVDYKLKGTPFEVDSKHELIIFRIFQECFSNVVKYSKATKLKIDLEYHPSEIIIKVADNGIGFNTEEEKSGSGMLNMQNRANLIGANLLIESKINEGVSVTLTYPTKLNS
ncbi:sensor histidine kinase [Joostella sp. CR20]|uniref:sensor histidine kinase n=1 Tax=Joostella sp. CR20 TaxID=2804312 RepID=UPI00313E166A